MGTLERNAGECAAGISARQKALYILYVEPFCELRALERYRAPSNRVPALAPARDGEDLEQRTPPLGADLTKAAVDLERLTSPQELERVEQRSRGDGHIALPRREGRRPEPSLEREQVALAMVRDIDPGPCHP